MPADHTALPEASYITKLPSEACTTRRTPVAESKCAFAFNLSPALKMALSGYDGDGTGVGGVGVGGVGTGAGVGGIGTGVGAGCGAGVGVGGGVQVVPVDQSVLPSGSETTNSQLSWTMAIIPPEWPPVDQTAPLES